MLVVPQGAVRKTGVGSFLEKFAQRRQHSLRRGWFELAYHSQSLRSQS